MYFKNCINIFKLLEKLVVFFQSLLPGYLYGTFPAVLASTRPPTRMRWISMRKWWRAALSAVGFIKISLLQADSRTWCSSTCEEETGLQLWGPDPVLPLSEGYGRITDLICRETERTLDKKRKRVEDGLGPANKKPRFEAVRPRWINKSIPKDTVNRGFHPWRRPGGRGRGYY